VVPIFLLLRSVAPRTTPVIAEIRPFVGLGLPESVMNRGKPGAFLLPGLTVIVSRLLYSAFGSSSPRSDGTNRAIEEACCLSGGGQPCPTATQGESGIGKIIVLNVTLSRKVIGIGSGMIGSSPSQDSLLISLKRIDCTLCRGEDRAAGGSSQQGARLHPNW
jgi:hypothetical protein